MYSVLFFSALAAAAPATQSTGSSYLAIPAHFKYGNYPRITADLLWGSPAQKPVETIMDTGSAGFWVFGPNSTINDGSNYLFVPGPCNKSVTHFYDPKNSKSSKGRKQIDLAYAYGGNGKIVSGGYTVNDTISFANTKWPALTGQQVGITNHTLVKQLDANCQIPESAFDHSILGLAPPKTGLIGVYPSFRDNLATSNPSMSSSFSAWFDAPPKAANGTFSGTILFGALPPANKYSGKLVSVKLNPPTDTYLGYYVSMPTVAVSSIKAPTVFKTPTVSDKTVTRCLVDSGTGTDTLPISQSSVEKLSGLITYQGYLAYNGSCSSIPASASFKFTFPGANAGQSVAVSLPIKNYARGTLVDETKGKVCGLSVTLDDSSCVLGAPFFSGAFLAFNDKPAQIAVAQGGVSTGQMSGLSGLGQMTVIPRGQKIPRAV
ncbi:acid protease [Myriangium duriaei CBS 260.36]|uniref:Acid protease n=1 Tax=Myriangium duriaei CBS 260.36 TaxID=1168546 RepID=A0A9P4MFJ8_9PEZI|nr:acid protease [Myriangium duriaei CBS 260.36]